MKNNSKLFLYTSLLILSFQACKESDDGDITPQKSIDPSATCKIVKMTDPDDVTRFEYNNQGQIIKEYINETLHSEITYNSDGKISTQTFPNRSEYKVETYTYNANGTIARYVKADLDQTFYYTEGSNPSYSITSEGSPWADTSFFTYTNGNLTKIEEHEYYNGGSSKSEINFVYDNKKLPTFLFNWENWMSNSNNVNETEYITYDTQGNMEVSEKYTSIMEYNAAGYPIKGSSSGWNVTLEYECN